MCKPLRGAWLLVGFLILLELLMGPHSGLGGALGVFQMAMAPVVRVLDIIALCWVGMWFGLRARKPLYIMGWTVGLVEVAPIALAYLLPVLFGTTRVYAFWPLVVPLLLVFKNLFFIRWAQVRLRAEFRTKDRIGAEGFERQFLAMLTGKVPEPQPVMR